MTLRTAALVALLAAASSAAPPIAPAPDPAYEATLRELHAELGRRYPGFELKRIDWEAVGKSLLPRARDVQDDTEFGLLCLELVARLEDTHARLLDGAATVPAPPLPAWSPGFACLEDDRGRPVVYHVEPGGPAAEAGITVGTTIVGVNGVPAQDAVDAFAARLRRWYGYSSERNLRYDAHRGFVGQSVRDAPVRLEIAAPDGTERGTSVAARLRRGYIVPRRAGSTDRAPRARARRPGDADGRRSRGRPRYGARGGARFPARSVCASGPVTATLYWPPRGE